MAEKLLAVVTLVLSGVTVSWASSCCKTGYDTYTWCSNYCCQSSFDIYDYCCSSYYSNKRTYYSYDSYCDTWWADHVWAAVLIGLGSLGVFIGIIVCCVCCIKGCTNDNRRTGTVIVNPAQPAHGAVFMTTAGQQGAYPGQMQQAVYPPGYAGPSGYPGPGGNIPPPSYDSKAGPIV